MSSAARSVMLAQKWDEKKDVVGWWMSEKLDGVRAYWSGSSFFSRNGIKFEAPDFFTRDLPRVPLDGELWCGRGLFSKTVSIIKKTKDWEKHADDWKYVTYLVFDAPGESTGYEARVAYMKKLIQDEKQSTYAAVVGIEKCRSKEHLQECMDKVIARGGEGLMLRKPNSKYECCRSHNLLKVKLFHSEEAKVVGSEKGTGRCSFMMGKLHCILPNKVAFKVGTGFSDAQRKRPPLIGSIIEFKYQEISDHGHPRFPVFLRERGDLTWEDVCNAAKKKKPFSELKTYKAPLLKKQHSILFSTVPSRDERGKKIVTEDDDDDDVDIPTSSSSHPACKYGADCYRTDERHLEAYTHPKSDKKDKRGRSPSPVRGRSPAPDRGDKSDKSEKKERSAVEEERDARLEREARDKSKSPTIKKRKAGDSKPPCRFGAKCYRTSKEHLADFSHPSSADAEDIENEEAQQVELEEGDISDDDVPRSSKKKSSPKTATSGDGEWGIGSASDSDDDSKPVAVSKREWNALQRQVKELQKLVASVHDDERDAKRQRLERADTLVITTTPALRVEGEDAPVTLVTASSMEIDSAIKVIAKGS